jgi:ribulose-phosphate 3-epimerase
LSKSQPQFLVSPSLLSADFARLGDEIAALEKHGADWLHVDVMDGHFVPNLTIGAPVVKSLKKVAKRPLDVHLMIEKPEKYVQDFIKAGADYLTIHVESTDDPAAVLRSIRASGVRPGITLRPATPLHALEEYLPLVDLVLVMTVNPGFGGQEFMEEQISKLSALAKIRKDQGLKYLIEVDGGINAETAKRCQEADVLVAGNYIFKNDMATAIRTLKDAKWK